jgi:outer membrane immunogenic protein
MRAHTQVVLLGFALFLLGPALEAAADGAPRDTPDAYPYTPPPTAGQYDWSGMYVGAGLGVGTAGWDWHISELSEQITSHNTGLLGGVQAGIQKQWDWTLLGLEVSYTWPNAGAASPSSVITGASRSADLSNLLMVAARAGATWENILAYLKVGYASADITLRAADPTLGVAASTSGRGQGWVTGLGIEYAIRPNINIGVEYDFIHVNAGSRDAAGLGAPGIREDGGVDLQAVMARVNYKFGLWAEPVPVR